MIKSGAAHSVAIGLNSGVMSCGSTALTSTIPEVIDYSGLVKLKTDKFKPINGLEGAAMKQVACGDYHTAVVDETGQLYAWGGSLH
jgi:alpha-tubulin suppressor-like RCC1 family protein